MTLEKMLEALAKRMFLVALERRGLLVAAAPKKPKKTKPKRQKAKPIIVRGRVVVDD